MRIKIMCVLVIVIALCPCVCAEELTRQEVENMLSQIDAQKASKDDVEMLKRVTLELVDEVEALGVRIEALSERIEALEKK